MPARPNTSESRSPVSTASSKPNNVAPSCGERSVAHESPSPPNTPTNSAESRSRCARRGWSPVGAHAPLPAYPWVHTSRREVLHLRGGRNVEAPGDLRRCGASQLRVLARFVHVPVLGPARLLQSMFVRGGIPMSFSMVGLAVVIGTVLAVWASWVLHRRTDHEPMTRKEAVNVSWVALGAAILAPALMAGYWAIGSTTHALWMTWAVCCSSPARGCSSMRSWTCSSSASTRHSTSADPVHRGARRIARHRDGPAGGARFRAGHLAVCRRDHRIHAGRRIHRVRLRRARVVAEANAIHA